MGIGVSVFLIAIGAILTFAVHTTVNGLSIHAVGIVLMIAGALGLAVTMTVFGPRRTASVVDRRTVHEGNPVVTGAPTYAAGSSYATHETVERTDSF